MRKIIALFWIGVLMAFSTTLSAAVTYCAPSAFGYGQSATGGGTATPVLVSSVSQLQSALNKGKNKVIIITQSLTFTSMLSVQDGSNVTLLGLPGVTLTSLQQTSSTSGILYIKRFNNLIIRNLTFVGPGAYDEDGNDLLCFESVTNAWVDHCDFQDGMDGNFDNKKLSDNVTISWCRFRYLKAPRAGGSGGSDDHRFTNLLGSSSSDAPSDGTFNYTWAYCWWDEGCKERMLRCRNASLHFLNCYWNSSVANYYIGPENADCYIEGCTFEGAPKTAKIFYQNYGGKNGSNFINCTATKGLPSNVSDRTVVTPSYPYTALTAAEAKTAVTNATCGAGATLTVTTAGVVSSTCDGGAPLPTVWTVTWDATTNGGSCGTATSSVTNGAAIGTLPEATKTSFNFDGWYTAPSGGTKISASTTVTENKTYYAQFTSAPVTTYYTVIWDANGGTCGTSSSSIESGQQIGTLPVASKAGDYSFDGWYTAVNGGTKISTTTTVTANVTYYAHYTATGGGGGGSCASTLTHYGTQYRTSAPRRSYAYVGSTSGTKFIIESDNGNTKNVDADSSAIRLDYSKYLKVLGPGATTNIADSLFTGVTQISFKWKLYNSGSTTRTTTVDVYVGGTKVGNAIELTGLNSDGFQAHTISSIASLSGAVTIKNTGTGNSNKNLHFDDISITYNCSSPSPTTYTLSYDENGGSGTMAATEQTGASVTVAANGFTAPTGYSFQEWNTDMNGGGTTKAVGASITLTEDMTLYAIWQPNTYTVTLNAEGGVGGSASVTATFDAALPNITIPTRDGYVFKGYYTGTDGTGTQYYDTNGSSTNDWTIAANTELHAYWETGSTPIVSGCDLHFWFVKEADATTNSKTNDGTFFSGMVTNSSSLSGSITIDGTSYSVTGRSGDAASFGSFTIPTGHAGTFYALAVSSGSGDRQINLVGATQTYELDVPGGSDSYKRLESEELPAGTYTIEREGSSKVRLGIVVVKVCSTEPCTPPAAPTAFATTDVASTTATFSITDPANTNNYEIYYSTNSTAPAVDATPTTTTATTTKAVSGLTSGTTYYAWVRAVCDADNKSAWVALSGSSFTTGKTQPTLYTVAASAEGECAGGMTVKVTLSGSQTGINYQLKNNDVNDGDAVAGTGNALEWTGKGSGVYTVWAVENTTYSARKMSKTITVEIYAATAITTQPATSVSAETDESFTLGSGMVAAGNELTYRWYTCSSTGTDTAFISGATSATYTTSQSIANTYYYRVRAAGTCGDPVLSDVITVTITSLVPPSAAPTISGQPASATYCAGDAITPLSVTASNGGSGTLTYQWKKDGVDIPSANGASYTPTEAGTYVCVVTNTEEGKTPTLLSSDEAVVTINAAVAAPTMSQTENTVTITTATAGATIYYTTDGTDPTTSSASGTSVIITADCTIKAYAVKDGCSSAIESFDATFDPTVKECAVLISYTLTTSGTATPTIAADENNLVGGSADYKVSSTSTGGGYKLNSDQYFGLTLASGQFKAGDKVTVTITQANDQGDKGLHLCTSKTGAAVLSIAADDVVVGDNVFTLEADCDAIYVARSSSCAQNPYVKAISVCRELVKYTVTFDKNNLLATGTMSDQSFYAGFASTLSANTFALDGYDFAGWATSSTGSKEYDDEQSITLTDNITLYALWTEKTYKLTNTVSPAGYGTVDPVIVSGLPLGATTTSSSNTYTVNGITVTATPAATTAQYTYEFSGWSGLPATVTADATVTANFTRAARTYTVTLNTNGGTINSGDVDGYTFGIGATLPTDITRTGNYDFAGWYDNSGFSGSPVTTIPDDATGDKEYWAKWISCPVANSGETLYKFEVNSSVTNGNICSSGNNPRALTTPTELSTLIGGTLEGYITDNSNYGHLQFDGGRITYKNGSKGVLNIMLDCPIREGDVIRFNSYSSNNNKYNYLRHTSNNTSTDQLKLDASTVQTEIQQIVAPAAFVGKTELFIVSGSNNTGLSYFEILRPCVLTLDAGTNGGTVGGNTTQEIPVANGETLLLPRAVKDGYRFKGWYEGPTGGSPVSDPYTVSGATTLYAQFEDCPHDGMMYKWETKSDLTNGSLSAGVSGEADIDANITNYLTSLMGGTATLHNKNNHITITNNSQFTFDDNAPYIRVDLDCAIEEGDIFKSTIDGNTVWVTKTTSRTSTAILPEGTLQSTPIPAALVGQKTLYIWRGGGNTSISYFEITRPKQTNITLSATGAYNHYTSSVVAMYGQAMPEIANLPLRTGYVFGGYYDEPDGAGTQYYDGLGVGVRNWDKDVVSATLYAHWIEPCDIAPTLTQTVPVVSIWDGKKVDLALVQLSCDFDATGINYSLASWSETIPGCTFIYFDERIYIQGTPTLGNTSTVTKTITFTMTNDCSSASTYDVEATIRIYPESHRAKIAYIITGTKEDAFDKWSTSDSTSSAALLSYLKGFYDVTCVNGYATKDASAIATYYDQYDLLIVTDYMETPEGYTNQIGTLIDKKPILSFEAYVAGEHGSNWHIGSNPKDPSPKVQDMKILCAGHAIFKNAEEVTVINAADTTVHVLSSLSSASDAKGLQGFVISEAPDYIFLATVRDENNKRDLIVCCERQVVFPARLLLYGINYYEMGNLSPAGKVVMHQMIDYLLMTDETKVADCSLVFDNGAGNTEFNAGSYSGTGTRGDGKWSTAANWSPGYNITPTPYHPTRIIAECHVDVDNAHAGSVKVNQGRDEGGNPVDGKLIVEPYGGLTVAGIVAKVNDTRYASPITIKAEDLLIKADDEHNGAFVYGNKESDVRATVEYYSRGANANTSSPVWQYMGIPFRANKTAISMYYEAWMCRWMEGSTDNLGGLWQWVDNYDVLVPFEGYCITQGAAKTYTNTGKLNAPVTTVISLDNRDADGYAFAANSWTAPIKIQEMQDGDFVNADRSIYIYHSGTYDSWNTNKETVINTDESTTNPVPGQYVVIPIHSAPYLGTDSVIPAMQGFFVKTTAEDASLSLVYNRVVYDAKNFQTSTQPMRAPRRLTTNDPDVIVLNVVGNSYGDRVHILSRGDFSEQFEDGWDGRKIEGDKAAPMLAVVKEGGEMAVAAVPTVEERLLSFRAGEDAEYTFSFVYRGETLYLYDLLMQQATLIRTGNTYTFTADNQTPINRFMLTANPPKLPTDVENTEYKAQNAEVQKLIIEDKVYILRGKRVYDLTGRRVTPFVGKEGAQ